MPGMMHMSGGSFGFAMMMLIMGLFWVGVLGGAGIYLLRRSRSAALPPGVSPVLPPPPSPLETLRERYAHGEIDTTQFEERVGRLVATSSPAETSGDTPL